MLLDPIFSLIGDFMYVLWIVEVISIIALLFLERSNPKSLILWTAALLLFPVIGLILYLFLGQTVYAKHVFKLKGVSDDKLREVLDISEKKLESSLPDTPESREKLSFVRSITRSGGSVYTGNNDVELITDGRKNFDMLYEDLRNAKRYINFEYYIIRNDKLGNELLEILTQKVKEGVKVRLLTDAFGNGKGPMKAIKEFKRAGGEFALFHSTAVLLLSPKKNNRNHRKLAVIDGDVGYVGGFNVGDEYVGEGPLGDWRDSSVRIKGASVMTINGRFVMDWNYASKNPIEIGDWLESDEMRKHQGDDGVQIVSGGPDHIDKNPVQLQYLRMIHMAKDTLYIHSPYFVPNESISDALTIAAKSGVDVRIIIPDKPDHPFVFWNNISNANKLMQEGVRIYMYDGGFVHSKTLVADGKWCSVGSANMDDRSLKLNFESNAMIYSERVGQGMNEAFLKDLERCKEYSCEEYAKRTFGMKIKIGISRLFEGLA